MAANVYPRLGKNTQIGFLAPALFLIIGTFILAYITVLSEDGIEDLFLYPYLLPWIGLTAITLSLPLFILYYKGKFNLFNPIIYAAWVYFIPAFVLGGLSLASGLSQPYYQVFIQDPKNEIPLTLVYVLIGFSSLAIGYLLPLGKKLGGFFDSKLPKLEWAPASIFLPGLFLVSLGFVNSIFAFMMGLIGFQKIGQIGQYDGLINIFTVFLSVGIFLLWLAVFRMKRLSFNALPVIVILLSITIIKAVFAGNRGSLLGSFIMISIAYFLAGKKIKWQQGVAFSISLVIVIFIGMVYGTTFRNVKQTESQISADEYVENIGKTFEVLTEQDMTKVLQQGAVSLAERMDAVTPLAVVVSNYEQLAPYEESYGLDNNIIKDTLTFIIPRVVWKDKPLASEPRKYGDLYFNYGDNSFTITPIGDLLRNFGVIGIPLGMALLGFFLRIIYSTLVEERAFSFWRLTLYYVCLTSVTYESFYGGILPLLVKNVTVTIVGLLIVWFMVRKTGGNAPASQYRVKLTA